MSQTLRERRRANDLVAVQELCAQSGGRIVIERTEGTPPRQYFLRFAIRTLGPLANAATPAVRGVRLRVDLPDAYPNPGSMPRVKAVGPIYHPHFFSPGGDMCIGNAPLTGLAAFVEWLGRVLVLDPSVTNEYSPANGEAMAWVRANRASLPLDPVDFRVAVVRDANGQATRPAEAEAPPAGARPRPVRIAWGLA